MEKSSTQPTQARAMRKFGRRHLLRLGAMGTAVVICRDLLRATPDVPQTEDNIEGPFYKPGAPERAVLAESGMPGTRLTVSGRVLSTRGAPLAGALLDVWQTDAQGQYDNKGFRLRGKLHTDRSGNYRLETVLPRYYHAGKTTRPSHIHVKVSAPGFPLLTTQLYFKGDPYNGSDPYVRTSLMLDPTDTRSGKAARFDFVLRPDKKQEK